MQSEIPLVVGLDSTLHAILTLHGVLRRVFQHIELVVIGVAVVGLEV